MNSGDAQSNSFNQLRQRAEAALHQGGLASPQGVQDIESLLHELQVHQIELELQNEELRRTQKDLTDSREQYADLYDFAPVGYFTFDRHGLIVQANLTGAGLLGVERTRRVKGSFTSFLQPGAVPAFRAHLREVFRTKDHQTCELECRTGSGEFFQAQLDSIAAADEDGDFTRCRTVLCDITERKRGQAELIAANVALAEANAKLAGANAELGEANARLAEADQRKNEFLAMLAHELRNPLETHPLRRRHPAPGGAQHPDLAQAAGGDRPPGHPDGPAGR